MKGWTQVIVLGILAKWPAKLSAPIAVLFVDRKYHPIWGVRDATDFSWWNTGFRNGARNLLTRPMPKWKNTYGNKKAKQDWTLEKIPGFQVRVRRSNDGQYVSLRITGGEVRKKGKREFYAGWKMNNEKTMVLTFFQLRIKWQHWLLLTLILYSVGVVVKQWI